MRNTECECEGGEPDSTAPPYLSPVSLYRTTLGFASHPSYLATWHLAQLRRLATGACNHNTGLRVAHPPALILLSLFLSFHSSHLRSLSSFSSTRNTLSFTLPSISHLTEALITNMFSYSSLPFHLYPSP